MPAPLAEPGEGEKVEKEVYGVEFIPILKEHRRGKSPGKTDSFGY